ncbi:MAG: hypothetical protein JWM53_3504 [bacterium]|nr:hypothetical protein [bacterium]
MRKIDRLGWTAGLSFLAQGVRVGIRVTDAAILAELMPLLPVGARPSSERRRVEYLFSIVTPRADARAGVRRFHLMYVDGVRITRTMVREELFADVERYLEQTLVVGAPRRLFLHAGVVGWRGRAIVLPGPSHAGKTTLVAELVRAGATYYSDEYAVMDGGGRVSPYPRPLRVRFDGDVDVRSIRPEELGKVGRRPLPVALVALTTYRAGARWRPRAVPLGSAMLELLKNAPAARLKPRAALEAIRPLAERARVVRGARGEAREVAASLLRAVDAQIEGTT